MVFVVYSRTSSQLILLKNEGSKGFVVTELSVSH